MCMCLGVEKSWPFNSRLLIFGLILLFIDQQTAVPGGAVPLRQLGTTHVLWEDRAEPGARGEEEGRDKIMNGQIHPDL